MALACVALVAGAVFRVVGSVEGGFWLPASLALLVLSVVLLSMAMVGKGAKA